MSVNKKEKARLEALTAFVNAGDAAAVVAAMGRLYSALGMRWEDRADAKRNARVLSHVHELAKGWFATIVDGGKLKPVIEEVSELLDDVNLHKATYFYNETLGRFEVGTEGRLSSQPPHAAAVLCMLPLLDDASPDQWRKRLGRCGYRNCQQYFFVTGKRSGQRFCSPAHSNIERVMRWRKKHED